MENSLLRIKFTPLVKKIHTEFDKNWYIEILPKLTAFKNLDKISCWKAGQSLTEYILPVTYKIIIKKGNNYQKKRTKKEYYSCVDLLRLDSTDDFRTGDLTKIRSDNTLFTLPAEENNDPKLVQQRDNKKEFKYVSVPTRQTTVSVQTINVQKHKDYLIRPRAVKDQCFGINIVEKASPMDQRVFTCEHSSITDSIHKYDKASEPMQICEEVALSAVSSQNNNLLTLQLHLDEFSKNVSDFEKIILPVNTCLAKISCQTTFDGVSDGESLKNHLSDRKTVEFKYKNSSLCGSRSQPGLHVTESSDSDTKKVYEINHEVNKFRKYGFRRENHCKELRDRKNAYKTCDFKSLSTENYEISCPKFPSFYDSKYCTSLHYPYKAVLGNTKLYINKTNALANASAAFELKHNNMLKNKISYVKDVSKLCTPRDTADAKQLGKLIRENNCTNRSKEFRVKYIVEIMKNELEPLNLKYNEIKSKCLMLGLELFCGEFVSTKNYIIFNSIAEAIPYNYNKLKKSFRDKKSNRVVYTVSFKG